MHAGQAFALFVEHGTRSWPLHKRARAVINTHLFGIHCAQSNRRAHLIAARGNHRSDWNLQSSTRPGRQLADYYSRIHQGWKELAREAQRLHYLAIPFFRLNIETKSSAGVRTIGNRASAEFIYQVILRAQDPRSSSENVALVALEAQNPRQGRIGAQPQTRGFV